MRHVAQQIRCTAAEVEDVVSYYTMFYTRPVGKYVLNVCRTLSCALLGAERVTEELSAKLGIKPGETDPTGTFTLMEVECLGACDRAPVVMVNDDWHERLAPEAVRGRSSMTSRRAGARRSPAAICTRRKAARPEGRRSTGAERGGFRPAGTDMAYEPSSSNTSPSRTPTRSTST